MPRSAAPVEPGTTPNAADAAPDTAPDDAQDGAPEAAAEPSLSDIMALVKAQSAEIERLKANQIRQATSANPTPAQLPTMAEALKDGPPAVPVLTKEGWFVPPVLPNANKLQ